MCLRVLDKRSRKSKGQSKMNSPETQ